jgi:geranyl-CoA carboxylase alpha subunit
MRKTGADAIHPGYGFLAENAAFALACREAGLVFIGPSPEAITAMGNKAGAKRLMIAAGVPCIPGYQGADQGEELLTQEASRIGYPVMIKATAGGGGRGMRLVPSASEFKDLLRSAQSEAQNSFGDPHVILERAIIEPRHIEIQIFADRQGNAIHLGERDCSVQRRHQKVVEESPSPAVNADLRERMGATAVAAVKAIAYEGAGTLEFLLDREGNYYFMEMNTRLQVEHPVTEAITGLDLVELQLRVAAGETLSLTQDEVKFHGHAIEVRLCAEDTDKGFMPRSGTVALWQAPSHLRVEHALESGTEIPPYYDSMIAKIIAHGRTRDEARRKLMRGLEDTVLLGVTTNQVFLTRCLAHSVFAGGGATTAFIEQNKTDLLAADTDLQSRATAIAACVLLVTAPSANHRTPQRQLAHTLPTGLHFEIDERKCNAMLTQLGLRRFAVEFGEQRKEVELAEITAHGVRVIMDGISESAQYSCHAGRVLLHYRGQSFEVQDHTRAASARQGEGGGDGKVRSSMNGRVVAVAVAVGQRVEAGQALVTLEAMKMEHVHFSPVAGTVLAVHAVAGEQVQSKRILVEVQADAVAPA